MAENIYKVHRVTSLPASGTNGDWYILKRGNRHEIYIVQPDGSLLLNKGITDAEQTKLTGLKTQSEIDSAINIATANATSSLIPVTSTVLPRGISVPSYITNKGIAKLKGNDTTVTTYTNTGTTPTTITVSIGFERDAFYDKTSDTWVAGLEQKLPMQTGVNTLNPTGTNLPQEIAVANYVTPKFDKILTSEHVTASINKANPILLKSGFYTTASIYVDSDNWIHWKGAVTPNTQYTVSGLAFLGTTIVRLVYFTASDVVISNVLATGNANSVTFTTPSNCYFLAVNIENSNGIGLNIATGIYPNKFMLELGSVANSFVPYQEEGDIYYADYNKIKNAPKNYSDIYYSFNKTGGTSSSGLFMIYVKRRGSDNIYCGYLLNHDYDMSDAIYTDQWRIIYANNYSFDGTAMSLIGLYGGLYLGESEYVYKRTSPEAIDHTGGTHGDEILYNVEFLVNGIIISTDVNISLTPIKEFKYIQRSATYRTPSAGEPITTHLKEGLHVKLTTFNDNGYTTKNFMTFDYSFTGYIYHGICCVGINNAKYVINDAGIKVQMMQDNGTNKASGKTLREINYSNKSSGYGAIVSSKILGNQDLNNESYMMVHDRINDSKYYRSAPTGTLLANKVYISETKVVMYKL